MAESKSARLKRQILDSQKELKNIINGKRAEIESLIREAVNVGSFSTSAATRDALYKAIVTQYISLNKTVDSWVEKKALGIAKEWHKIALEDLPKGDGKTFGQFSQKYLDDIVSRINPAAADKRILLNAKFSSMASEDVRAVRSSVTESIRVGAIEGWNNKELAASMKEKLSAISPAAQIIDKAGRTLNADSYFAMLNRTLHSTVARETSISMATDAGYDLFSIEGGITAGSLEPNDPCSRWAGRIISMSGNTPGYPSYQDALDDGMFHPNCVHTLQVVTDYRLPEAKKEEKETQAEGAEARKEVNADRKESGLTPAKF